MTDTIAVVDYGMGNLRSVAKALEHVTEKHCRVRVTSDCRAVASAARIVFPGQGAARDCMAQLQRHGLTDVILEAARSKPFLGICMGLQVLLEVSEENDGTGCLGLYPGESRYFGEPLNDPDSGERLKVPHMGWNRVWQQRPHPLWAGIADGARFYFVHSYYVAPRDRALTVASTDYGLRFTSAIADKNLFACQFHPEKSARDGLQLLKNFTRWEAVPP